MHQKKVSEDDENRKESHTDWETQDPGSFDEIMGVEDSETDKSPHEDNPRKESATDDKAADQEKDDEAV